MLPAYLRTCTIYKNITVTAFSSHCLLICTPKIIFARFTEIDQVWLNCSCLLIGTWGWCRNIASCEGFPPRAELREAFYWKPVKCFWLFWRLTKTRSNNSLATSCSQVVSLVSVSKEITRREFYIPSKGRYRKYARGWCGSALVLRWNGIQITQVI